MECPFLALFRDDFHARWELRIDRPALARLREQCGYEVPTIEAFNRAGGRDRIAAELEALYHDRTKVVAMLWAIVVPQAQRRGITRGEFERRLEGCYSSARKELFESFANFNFGNRLSTLITNFHDGIEDYAYGRA